MTHYIYVLARRLEFMVTHMDREQWAVVGLSVVVLAFFTMRGFGSNKSI